MSEPRHRLLINAVHAKAGGGVSYLRNMLPLLAADARLDVHLVVHQDQTTLFEPLPTDVGLHVENFRSSFLSRLLWEQIVLPFRARALRADVTFCPANFCAFLAPRPVILLRNTTDAAATETRFGPRLYWKTLKLMTWASVKRCRHIIAVSEYARRVLAGRNTRSGVSVIAHGVDEFYRAPATRIPRERFLLAVGSIYQQKNYRTLLHAFAKVRKAFPDVTLTIAGGVPPGNEAHQASLKRAATTLGIENSVKFAGEMPRERLADLYRRCAVFVFPSTAETFGQPLLEAMASGAPVVCSNTTAMPEVVGDAARMVDPLDADGMAAQIGSVLGDPALAARMSDNSQARAAQFSWAETARRTADVLTAAAGISAHQPAHSSPPTGQGAAGE